jgi:LmbE family N-acetylglucosaminyl deacetylase
VKALALVAHPDDCLIFGYHFITANKKFKWKIVYLTHAIDHPRFAEMFHYWNSLGVQVGTMGFVDDWDAVSKGKLGFKKTDAVTAINQATEGYDLILTHNFKGEYGHPHHIFLNKAVAKIKTPKVYFGDYPDYCNLLHTYDEDPYNIADFWLHQNVLRECDIRTYKYFVTDEAKALL